MLVLDFKKTSALIGAKLVSLVLQPFPSGATAAPGLLALKIDPKIVVKLSKSLSYSIVVSGTNGKTTTTRMIASILKTANIPILHNRTGSNLLRGIGSSLAKNHRLFKNQPKKVGLWEADEAALPKIVSQLKPSIIVITNLFRDQLDRYGEIDTLAKKWLKTIKKLPVSTTLILNADDPTLGHLGKLAKCQVQYFSIKNTSLGSKTLSHASDATLCPVCLLPLSYQAAYISHLGTYKCPECGPIQPRAQLSALSASFKNERMNIKVKDKSRTFQISLNIFGTYNIYNVLASFLAGLVLKIDPKTIIQGLKTFVPAFGRFEKIKIKDKSITILLAKNPAGFNQVIKCLSQLAKANSVCLLALNDLIADGKDVSWIWDVDFEELKKIKLSKLFVSGTRAYDLGLRLKHANLNKTMDIQPSLNKALGALLNQSSCHLFIIPTYTAMLRIRAILSKKGITHQTWKD